MIDLKEKEEQLKRSVTINIQDNDRYSNDYNQRGVCLILENEEFHESLALPKRGKSGVDASVMIRFFKTLGFEVII